MCLHSDIHLFPFHSRLFHVFFHFWMFKTWLSNGFSVFFPGFSMFFPPFWLPPHAAYVSRAPFAVTPRHPSVEVPDPVVGTAADAVEDHGGGQETERRQIPAVMAQLTVLLMPVGVPTPLKNMSSSVGMMMFPIYGKS